MDNLNKLIQKYGSYIQTGEKSIDEMICFLKEKGDVLKSDLSDIPKIDLGCFVYNLINSNINFNSKLKCNNFSIEDFIKNPLYYIQLYGMKFAFYQFLHCNNQSFYDKYKTNCGESTIYIVFEENTRLFHCNCSKLYIELGIFKGISENDVKNRTTALYQYLSYLEASSKEWY